MSIDVIELIRRFVQQLLSDAQTARDFLADPYGSLAAQGITDADLSGVDVRQIVGDVCGSGAVAPAMRSALQSYTSGSSGPPEVVHHHTTERVVQQLSYVTNVAYQDDHSVVNIVDSSTTIDQSTDIKVGGDFFGDIDVDQANATGEGAVAAGAGSVVNAATGDGAQVIDGPNFGQANTGDGAVQVGNAPLLGGPGGGPMLTRGENLPGLGGGIGPIVTGGNSGVVAGGPVSDTVVGDGNTTANIDGPVSGGAIDFGSGDAANVVGNTLGHGAAIGAGSGSVHGSFTETTTETTHVTATDSVVGTAQGAGDLDQAADLASDPLIATAPAPPALTVTDSEPDSDPVE